MFYTLVYGITMRNLVWLIDDGVTVHYSGESHILSKNDVVLSVCY